MQRPNFSVWTSIFAVVLTVLFSPNLQAAPIGISTCQELQNIKNNLTGQYALLNDIDCSETKNWNNGQGFEPIGNEANPFKGTFTGNNFSIYGLYINRPGSYVAGLFGYVRNSLPPYHYALSKVKLRGINITGGFYVGGLAGIIGQGVLVEQVDTDGVISSGKAANGKVYSSVAGGLIGATFGGEIFYCGSNVLINGRGDIGGLIGRNNNTIYNATAKGLIDGGDSWDVGSFNPNVVNWDDVPELTNNSINWDDTTFSYGGLVGVNNGQIESTYSWVRWAARQIDHVKKAIFGGLVGKSHVDHIPKVLSNSYSAGAAYAVNWDFSQLYGGNINWDLGIDYGSIGVMASSGINWDEGGLVGFQGRAPMAVLYGFWDKDVSKITTSVGTDPRYPQYSSGKTTTELKTAGYVGGPGWTHCKRVEYPTLDNELCFPVYTEEQELPVNHNSSFGVSLAMSGDLIAGAAPHVMEETHPTRGRVYLYKREIWDGYLPGQNDWHSLKTLLPAPGENQFFGLAVAMDSNLVTVLGQETIAGASKKVIYTFSGANWSEESKLIVDQLSVSSPIAVSGNNLAIIHSNVYMYTKNPSGGWLPNYQTITPPSGYVMSADLEGETLVVGAVELLNGPNGKVYLYQKDSNGTWQFISQIAGNAPGFGASVALDAGNIIVGVRQDDCNGWAAYVYTNVSGNWQGTRLMEKEAQFPPRGFAESVAIKGNTVAVSVRHLPTSCGNPLHAEEAVLVFTKAGDAWIPAYTLKPSDFTPLHRHDGLPTSIGYGAGHPGIALSDTTLAVGAYLGAKQGYYYGAGKVYFYSVWPNGTPTISASDQLLDAKVQTPFNVYGTDNDPFPLTWNVRVLSGPTPFPVPQVVPSDRSARIIWPVTNKDATWQVEIKATDYDGLSATSIINVRTVTNFPPTVNSIRKFLGLISWNVSDKEDKFLTSSYRFDGGAWSPRSIFHFTAVPASLPPGNHTIEVKAYDTKGLESASKTLNFVK